VPDVKDIWARFRAIGAQEVKAAIEEIAAEADKLSHDDITIPIRLDGAGTAMAEMEALSRDASDLNGTDVTIPIKTDGAAAATVEMEALSREASALNGKDVTIKIGTDGAATALAEIEALKHAGGGGGGGGFGSWLRGLLGGGSGGLGALLSSGSNPFSGISWGPIGIGAVVTAVASMLPSLIPFATGLGVGGIGHSALTQLQTLQQNVASATRGTPQYRLAQQQLHAFRMANGPQIAFGNVLAGFGHNAESALMTALLSKGPGKMLDGVFAAKGPSFMSGLTGIIKQFGGFLKSIGPDLGTTLRASLPFLKGFMKIFEHFATLLGPAATKMMKQFTPFIPQMVHGFTLIAKGLVGFLGAFTKHGMKSSVTDFIGLMKIIEVLLPVIGAILNFVAVAVADVGHWFNVAARWVNKAIYHMERDLNHWRHDIAKAFDEVRHTIATWAHDFAHWFDDVRHKIATTFNRIVTDVKNWVRDVIDFGKGVLTWFQQLPGKIVGFLAKLPGMLFQAGKNAIQGLINGIKSMFGALGSVVSSIASKVAGFFGLSPAVEGPLSGGGAPEIRGRHFAEAFAQGMISGTGNVQLAAARLAHSAAFGAGHSGIGSGSGAVIRLEVTGGSSSGLDQMFMTWLKQRVRVAGGEPLIFSRKVVLR
jgi:hypothetical protein